MTRPKQPYTTPHRHFPILPLDKDHRFLIALPLIALNCYIILPQLTPFPFCDPKKVLADRWWPSDIPRPTSSLLCRQTEEDTKNEKGMGKLGIAVGEVVIGLSNRNRGIAFLATKPPTMKNWSKKFDGNKWMGEEQRGKPMWKRMNKRLNLPI